MFLYLYYNTTETRKEDLFLLVHTTCDIRNNHIDLSILEPFSKKNDLTQVRLWSQSHLNQTVQLPVRDYTHCETLLSIPLHL